jgi:hypothetical protein
MVKISKEYQSSYVPDLNLVWERHMPTENVVFLHQYPLMYRMNLLYSGTL